MSGFEGADGINEMQAKLTEMAVKECNRLRWQLKQKEITEASLNSTIWHQQERIQQLEELQKDKP